MRIGIVADLHAPFTHPMYLKFCLRTFEDWQVERVHFIGDIVDAHALGFYDHDPNGLSAETEAQKAAIVAAEWYKEFPSATVSIGNHDERNFRVARKAGIPDRYLKAYSKVWSTPDWKWEFETTIEGVLYEHGTGTAGKDAAFNRACQKRVSTVVGHTHSYAGIKYHSNPYDRIFGLNVGCGIDLKAYAFDYGKMMAVRPVLGCGIVLDGLYGHFIPMACSRGEPYHRSRAPKNKRQPWIIRS